MRYVTVRYSHMYYRGRFVFNDDIEVKSGLLCLIKSPRGVELGKILSDPVEYEGEVVWLKNSKTHGEKSPEESEVLYISGEIIRIATDEDVDSIQNRFAQGTDEEMQFCNERIKGHNLPMKLAGVEYLFEGEKIIFYFLADGRVDFRNLVKDLAKKYRTRIEMKQIGVRDEARLLAEYEHCGRRLCCKGFLNNLEPVTMKMAKSQKTTLDPSKISGRCGRLMCCLRYEDHVYQELRDNLPSKGTLVCLKSCKAKVLSQDVLQQKLLVETDEGTLQHIRLNEIVDEKDQVIEERDKKNQRSRRSSRRSRPRRDRKPSSDKKEGQRSSSSQKSSKPSGKSEKSDKDSQSQKSQSSKKGHRSGSRSRFRKRRSGQKPKGGGKSGPDTKPNEGSKPKKENPPKTQKDRKSKDPKNSRR